MMTFEEMRPYSDAEIPGAMERIVEAPVFAHVAAFLYPDQTIVQAREMLLGIRSVHELQENVMKKAVDRILMVSHSSFTCHIDARLRKDEGYLFVSNHRAIVLDAWLLQRALTDNGFETSQIIFGNNLLKVPLMADAGRANKLVGIDRGGNPVEFYRCLNVLSQYIRRVVSEEGESVWIAQGNGRTKNGMDNTDAAIVKMFAMSSERPLSEAVSGLRPVPVSIAYEWEPCDVFKAVELAKSRYGKYVKKEDEDFRSVVSDLVERKGRVHLEIGAPLDVREMAACKDDARKVAALLDKSIVGGYRLFPSNFLAYDLREGGNRFADRYSAEDRACFEQRRSDFRSRLASLAEGQPDDFVASAESIFLDIYANPVSNALAHKLV